MDFNDHPLWKFSLAVYGAPGVSAACLELQERRGADVNLLLYGAYVGLSGRGRLGAADWAACQAAVGPWSSGIVQALRQVRRTLKTDLGQVTAVGAAGLRRQVQAIEIEAEKLEQATLAARLDALPIDPSRDVRADALTNLHVYLATLAAPDVIADDTALATIARALPPSA